MLGFLSFLTLLHLLLAITKKSTRLASFDDSLSLGGALKERRQERRGRWALQRNFVGDLEHEGGILRLASVSKKGVGKL